MKSAELGRRSMVKGMLASALMMPGVISASGKGRAGKAKIVISLDLEMSREFPTREQMHWDYEKGNLDEASKKYAVEAARRVKAGGGLVHFFALGRTMEQADVSWLEGIIKEGHSVGNHTYDHINLLAQKPEDLQFRFKRAPWLMDGRSVAEEIRHNIRQAEKGFSARLGLAKPDGFRTPGGFYTGLKGREDLQRLLIDLGYKYVSSMYPSHAYTKPGERPGKDVFDSIVAAQEKSQPFRYAETGLLEIPMSPISDVGAFRTGRWPVEDFVEATRRGLKWAIERGAVYDFLGHPSCLGVADPEFRTIDAILELVNENKERAEIVTLGQITLEG